MRKEKSRREFFPLSVPAERGMPLHEGPMAEQAWSDQAITVGELAIVTAFEIVGQGQGLPSGD